MSLTDALLIALVIAVCALVVRRTASQAAAADRLRTDDAAAARDALAALLEGVQTLVRRTGEDATAHTDRVVDAVAIVAENVEISARAFAKAHTDLLVDARINTQRVLDPLERLALDRTDAAAPRGQRVALTDVDDVTFRGFLAHEDEHRLILEGAVLARGDGEIPMSGRQHFRVARVKRVQELGD